MIQIDTIATKLGQYSYEVVIGAVAGQGRKLLRHETILDCSKTPTSPAHSLSRMFLPAPF